MSNVNSQAMLAAKRLLSLLERDTDPIEEFSIKEIEGLPIEDVVDRLDDLGLNSNSLVKRTQGFVGAMSEPDAARRLCAILDYCDDDDETDIEGLPIADVVSQLNDGQDVQSLIEQAKSIARETVSNDGDLDVADLEAVKIQQERIAALLAKRVAALQEEVDMLKQETKTSVYTLSLALNPDEDREFISLITQSLREWMMEDKAPAAVTRVLHSPENYISLVDADGESLINLACQGLTGSASLGTIITRAGSCFGKRTRRHGTVIGLNVEAGVFLPGDEMLHCLVSSIPHSQRVAPGSLPVGRIFKNKTRE